MFNDICLVAIDESTKVDCAIGNDDDDDAAADSSSYNVDDKRGMWVYSVTDSSFIFCVRLKKGEKRIQHDVTMLYSN